MSIIDRAAARLGFVRNFEAARPATKRDLQRFPAGSINGAVVASAGSVRARARFGYQNNSHLRSAVHAWTSALLGADGPRPVGGRVRATRVWAEWSRTNGFPRTLRSLCNDMIVCGEALAVLNGDVLSPLPIEQLSDESDGATLFNGIHVDAFGRPLAYRIFPGNPDAAAFAQAVTVDGADVMHLYRLDVPGQMRGISWLGSAVLPASELNGLLDSLVIRNRVAANLIGSLTQDPIIDSAAPASIESFGETSTPATMITLNPGEKLEFYTSQPGLENAAVIAAKVREIAAGIGVPTHFVDGDLSRANYSSLRAGLLPFYASVEAVRHTVLAPALDRLWTRITGAEPPSEWLFPALPAVDPMKQTASDLQELAAGLTSRRRLAAERGWNLEELDAELAAEGWTPPTAKEPR